MAVLDRAGPAAAAVRARSGSSAGAGRGVTGPADVAALGLLAAWQLGAWAFGLPIYIAPTPVQVARTLVAELPIYRNFLPTAVESFIGFLVGNTAAILLAVVFIHGKRLEAAFYPIAVFVNTIPVLAKAPILVLIFGLGMTSKVVIAAFICFFPTLANMVRGLSRSTRSPSIMRVLSASRAEVFWKLRVPSSLPFLFSALKIASTTSVLGAIVGEWIGADLGLAPHHRGDPQLPLAPPVRHDLRRVRLGGRLLRGGQLRRAARRHLEAGRGPLAMAEPRSVAEVARRPPSSGNPTCWWSGAGRRG